jgi:hypothetical protein
VTAQCVPLLFLEPVLSMHSSEPVDHIWSVASYEFVTDDDINYDLRPLSDRAETPYEKSTAIQTGDAFVMRMNMFGAAARKVFK